MRNCILSKMLVVLMLALVGCSSTKSSTNDQQDLTSLDGLKSLSYNKGIGSSVTKGTTKIRQMGLKEMALSVGARSGLAKRAKEINEQLVRNAKYLDQVFDFNALVLEHNVMPPVLLSGHNTFKLSDAQTIRISDRSYKVAKQAHFITVPPTWRQYLWMDYKKPEIPSRSMLPRNKEEKKIWKHYVEEGWNDGIEQANVILREQLARLKEDYTGMIRYRKLLAMNMVSPPYVADTNLGVTGDGNEMHIDDRVLRITALPALKTDANSWRAALTKDEDLLKKFRHMEKRATSSTIRVSSRTWQPVIAPPAGE